MIIKAVANFELHFDNNKFSDVLKIFAIRILVPFTTLLTTYIVTSVPHENYDEHNDIYNFYFNVFAT